VEPPGIRFRGWRELVRRLVFARPSTSKPSRSST
jgi:hypothetical protein